MKAIDIQELRQAAIRCQDLMELLNYSHKGLVEDKFAMMEPVFREFHRVASAAKISDLCLYVEQMQTEAEKAREYKESAERELAIRSDVEAVSGGPDTIILPKPVLVHISSEEKLVIPLHSTLTELTRLGHSFCYEDENS